MFLIFLKADGFDGIMLVLCLQTLKKWIIFKYNHDKRYRSPPSGTHYGFALSLLGVSDGPSAPCLKLAPLLTSNPGTAPPPPNFTLMLDSLCFINFDANLNDRIVKCSYPILNADRNKLTMILFPTIIFISDHNFNFRKSYKYKLELCVEYIVFKCWTVIINKHPTVC